MIVPLDSYLHEHFKQFAGLATVVTYDLRNRGRSERAKDESSWTIQQDARDLEAVRRELKIDKFIPVGFSYLGIVVAMYAMEHPDRVTRLIQIGPASYRKVGTPLQESNEAMGVPPENEKRMAEARGNPATPGKEQCEATWNVLKYMFVGNPAHAPRFDLGFCALENEWPSNFNNTVMHVMKSMADVSITPEKLQVVKVPVLTIHGDKDRNAPYDGGVDWVKSFPDARLVTVKGAAHASYIDDPVTVFGAIRHFIRGEWPLFSTAAR
jgi:pimeloyl-ACP methyl ester carboxylesterase